MKDFIEVPLAIYCKYLNDFGNEVTKESHAGLDIHFRGNRIIAQSLYSIKAGWWTHYIAKHIRL